MKLLSVKVTCPSCSSQIYLNDCRIISRVHPGTALRRRLGKREIPLDRLIPERLASPEYVRELASRECPECRYFLPHNIESVDKTVNVAIIGDVDSGKSHYIAALLRHIQAGEVQSENQYLHFTCLTPDVLESYRQEYIEPLFGRKQVLPPTRPLNRLLSPLIYEINSMKSSKLPAKRINLVVYEVSAREYADLVRLGMYRRFALCVDAILYLVDPLGLPGFLNSLPHHLRPLPAISMRTNPATLLNSIASVEITGPIYKELPYAIVLSKADLLPYALGGKPYKFLDSPPKGYRKGISLEHLNLIDPEVQQWISNWDRGLLTRTQQFLHVHFFAISATGHPPDENGFYPAIEPLHCTDPLLWILDRLGVVKIE